MCPGSVWQYLGLETTEPYTTTCTGTEDFWGVECAVFANSGPGDDGLSQYYYIGANGNAVLRGFFREYENWGALYDPGLEIMSDSPYLGQQWCSTADWYDLPDYGYMGTYEYCLEVQEEVDLVLPAGTIHALGIGFIMPPTLRPGYDLFGRERSSTLSDAARWYSYEIGEVQFLTADLYQIAGYSLPPSATEVASWSGIKALYR
jgi:hypothetical protein